MNLPAQKRARNRTRIQAMIQYYVYSSREREKVPSRCMGFRER